jgi:GrpB-like predicted nucleotidyltransferase (UPF0157 family)
MSAPAPVVECVVVAGNNPHQDHVVLRDRLRHDPGARLQIT